MATVEQFLVDWDGEFQPAQMETEFHTEWVDHFTRARFAARRRNTSRKRPAQPDPPAPACTEGPDDPRPVLLSMAAFLSQETEGQRAPVGQKPTYGTPRRCGPRTNETPPAVRGNADFHARQKPRCRWAQRPNATQSAPRGAERHRQGLFRVLVCRQ